MTANKEVACCVTDCFARACKFREIILKPCGIDFSRKFSMVENAINKSPLYNEITQSSSCLV